MKGLFSTLLSVLWFFGAFIWALLIFLPSILFILMDIAEIISSGYAMYSEWWGFFGLPALIFAITMMISPLRKCIRTFPWLYPMIVILTMDLVILSIGAEIINNGYLVLDSATHSLSVWFGLFVIVVLRVIMCSYFCKKPIRVGRAASCEAKKDASSTVQSKSNADGKHFSKGLSDRRLMVAGVLLFVVFIVAVNYTPKPVDVDASKEAAQAQKYGESIHLPLGVRLYEEDCPMQGRDVSIHQTVKQEKLHIWDTANDEGDYVQIFVDGEAVCEPFMMTYTPQEFSVPATGLVEVRGIHDNGDSINYAVHFEGNGITYFNTTNEGEENRYTLKAK